MTERQSSVPGLAAFPVRNRGVETGLGFLEARREVDGAEGLWRINNSLYDLKSFVTLHPGGEEWIRLTKGTDITEAFETHHLTDKARNILPKYYVRDVSTPRSVPLTFKENGFYRTFKKRVVELLKDVDFHRPAKKTNLIADFLASSTFALCIAAAVTQSYVPLFFAGVFLTWTTIIGHNYFHMRDSFRMYYFDLSLMSSKEWRISHAMSHHIYPNTTWDYEMYSVEPFLNWTVKDNKNLFNRFLSQLYSPIVWTVLTVDQGVKRYYSVLFKNEPFEFRDAVPFFLPLTMAFFSPSVWAALKMWWFIILLSSFMFGMVGFNAAHHHPDIFHDGDIYRDDMDWGLLELDAVRERRVIDDVDFLVLTNFGNHCLHHLLPTVDHCYLPLCRDTLEQTCKDFGLKTGQWSQWELLLGQFRQLARIEPKKNHR